MKIHLAILSLSLSLKLQAFLNQRVNELTHTSMDANHLSSAPGDIHLDQPKVVMFGTQVKDILDQLTSVHMQQLMLIRDSPRSAI